LNKEEVLELIGKENETKFDKFMYGQTTEIINGVIDYYDYDVEQFCKINKIEVNKNE